MENNVHILVVEDSPTQAIEIQCLLEKNHYRVSVAPDGQRALKMLSEITPTIIISDIVMPEMNGYALCSKIKENARFKDIPVILLTSLSDPEDVINGLVCGANNFIVKPYDEKFLLSRIKYVLANREIRKTASSQMGIEIIFRGKRYFLTSERVQMIDLLLSTYEAAIQRNHEYVSTNQELKKIKNELEIRVQERTAALSAANENLKKQIEERKHAEEALKESEERFRNIFEKSAIGKAMIALDGSFLHVNQSFADMIGYTTEEIQRFKFADITHLDDIEPSRKIIRKLLTDELSSYQFEKRYLHRNGDIVWTDISIVLLKANTGKPQYFITSIRDITGRKSLEEQLQQAMKMEAVGRLAGGVAHDFNNALTPIMGISEILLGQLQPGHPMYEDIKEINESAERCAGLTRQLLAFGRRQTLETKIINLNEVVINMEKMLSRVIGEDIRLDKFLAPDLGNVTADVGQMEQILANLVVNARDAMPNGGKITIETDNIVLDEAYAEKHIATTPGTYVMLAVSDTGTGMDKQTQAHIFDPFFTTKAKGKGTGLGLSTVYGIVRQSGGNIWCYSEPGKGTAFKIYLPRVNTEAETLKKQKPDRSEDLKGAETILLVEDEDNVRRVARRILASRGYNILEAESGEAAVKVSGEHSGPIHLLVTDVVMTGMSGRELAGKLADSRPEMKVLYVSGYTDNAIVHHGVLDKGTHFLQKPFTIESLARKVRQVLV